MKSRSLRALLSMFDVLALMAVVVFMFAAGIALLMAFYVTVIFLVSATWPWNYIALVAVALLLIYAFCYWTEKEEK